MGQKLRTPYKGGWPGLVRPFRRQYRAASSLTEINISQFGMKLNSSQIIVMKRNISYKKVGLLRKKV